MRREGRLRLIDRDAMPLLLLLAGLDPRLHVAGITRIGMANPSHVAEDSAKHADIAVDGPIGEMQRTPAREDPRSAKMSTTESMHLSAPTAVTKMQKPHHIKRRGLGKTGSGLQRRQTRRALH